MCVATTAPPVTVGVAVSGTVTLVVAAMVATMAVSVAVEPIGSPVTGHRELGEDHVRKTKSAAPDRERTWLEQSGDCSRSTIRSRAGAAKFKSW